VQAVLHVGEVAHVGSAQPTLPLQFESTVPAQFSGPGTVCPVHTLHVESSALPEHVCVPSLHAPLFRVAGSPE
jgi:hypothetical protein